MSIKRIQRTESNSHKLWTLSRLASAKEAIEASMERVSEGLYTSTEGNWYIELDMSSTEYGQLATEMDECMEFGIANHRGLPNPEAKTALCICRAGKNRSRAMAYFLNKSVEWKATYMSSRERGALREAAEDVDVVFVVDYPEKVRDRCLAGGVPPEKIRVVNTGKDIWGRYDHPDLEDKVRRLMTPYLTKV